MEADGWYMTITNEPPLQRGREGHNANRARRAEGYPLESTLESGKRGPTASWPQYPQGGRGWAFTTQDTNTGAYVRPGCRPTSLEGAPAPRDAHSGALCTPRRGDRLWTALAASRELQSRGERPLRP